MKSKSRGNGRRRAAGADGGRRIYRAFAIRVVAEDCALRVLVPPAVAAREVDSRQEVLDVIARDGRDPVTGQFA